MVLNNQHSGYTQVFVKDSLDTLGTVKTFNIFSKKIMSFNNVCNNQALLMQHKY